MIGVYIDGEQVGTVSDDTLAKCMEKNNEIEFRNAQGQTVAKFPFSALSDPNGPLVPWDASFTRKELERRRGEESFTYEEMKKRLGWE